MDVNMDKFMEIERGLCQVSALLVAIQELDYEEHESEIVLLLGLAENKADNLRAIVTEHLIEAAKKQA